MGGTRRVAVTRGPGHSPLGHVGSEERMMNLKHLLHTVVGGMLVLVGVVLLVLPGPGLLVVLAGLLLLSSAFPRLERYVHPVRARAAKAAEDSVSSWWRIAGSVLTGAALIGAGLVWALVPGLPFGGWHTGSSIIVSGLILFAVLIYTGVQVRKRRGSQ
jgi:Putative transmembrane protein (PGPGW)